MADSTNIVVPGDVTTTDKRRFRIIPLTKDNIDRAGIGEIAVDRDTGDVYVINNDGEAISRTSSLEKFIQDVMNNDLNTLSFMYNHNRRVYRLFFNDGYVKLDPNLITDNSCAYWRVRSIEDIGVYYVKTLTPIGQPAIPSATLVDNECYFVEFYNKNKEQVSCIPFSAKAALYFDSKDADGNSVSAIKIYTNKDVMYVNEDIESLIVKLFAVYDDGTEKDITDYASVDIDMSEADTSKEGSFDITATWVYDIDNVMSLKTTYTIFVEQETVASITDLVVVPKKIIMLNDGSREIRLSVIAYFVDGTTEDVTERCIVSNFDKTLFNEEQIISVTFNAGTESVYEQTYTIMVKDNGESSEFKLLFNNESILELDDSTRLDIPYPVNTAFYKVRCPENLTEYYTPTFCEIHYDAIFTDIKGYELALNKNVIVEFYDEQKNLLDSDVYSTEYSELV